MTPSSNSSDAKKLWDSIRTCHEIEDITAFLDARDSKCLKCEAIEDMAKIGLVPDNKPPMSEEVRR